MSRLCRYGRTLCGSSRWQVSQFNVLEVESIITTRRICYAVAVCILCAVYTRMSHMAMTTILRVEHLAFSSVLTSSTTLFALNLWHSVSPVYLWRANLFRTNSLEILSAKIFVADYTELITLFKDLIFYFLETDLNIWILKN